MHNEFMHIFHAIRSQAAGLASKAAGSAGRASELEIWLLGEHQRNP